jgi:predicted NBD/HSP70 family sugar kinase
MKPVWGIDLGGTKIEGVILEHRDSRTILDRRRVPTGAENGYEHILQQIGRLLQDMSDATGLRPERVGIGTPGTGDPLTGLHKNSNTTCLNGMPFRADVQEFLCIPVAMANDANCFAVAEANLGAVRDAAPDASVVFGVIMGTGVGGGVVVDGKVINGRHGIGGEWGHNFLDTSGGECYCGKVGCVERIISGPALEGYYESLTGTRIPLPEVWARMPHDAAARETHQRMITFFGKSIASIINVLDPDAIVLGGGVGNTPSLYTEGVAEAAKHVFNPRLDTLFLRPKLGDSAGVIGAALL